MTVKKKVISEIIRVEGGYVNDPNDSGRATKYGVTISVARAAGYAGDMRDMPASIAFGIYERRYWDAVRADDMPEVLAAEVVDTAVNMGVSRAGKFLQRALNVLTPCEALRLDGQIGPGTIGVLNAYLAERDVATLVKAVNCLQGAYYIELAERRVKDERFIYGWLNNRVSC